ncbi:MAG: tRNA dihydrouridine(20/20a) synthase DusA [Gammaproteobacteria bacterium]|nr:MAG: tRNA dihydrouridine(20/20a) synthase DusA [Gammaproteobacteria bacterium]
MPEHSNPHNLIESINSTSEAIDTKQINESNSSLPAHRFCVAPLLDCTDRHARYFLRLLTKRSFLYTEMITTGALIHGDREGFLAYNQEEHPVALQLGGSEPKHMQQCTQMAYDSGYDEVNINVGCPSDRVQRGMFGACLMKEADMVADCVNEMKQVPIPITIKSRIGVDDHDSYEQLVEFVSKTSQAGCQTFIIHARKAWLKGLSPKQNREVPPLNYPRVYQLKQDFPELEIIINGGITEFGEINDHLTRVDGVMLGREAYHNPFMLAEVDNRVFGESGPTVSRQAVVEQMIPYIETQVAQGVRLKHMTRHILGLFRGIPGARLWRRHLSENAHKPEASVKLLTEALKLVDSSTT